MLFQCVPERQREPGSSITEWLMGTKAFTANQSETYDGFCFEDKKSISSEFPCAVVPNDTVIPNVTKEHVWNILVDFDNYGTWNPLHKRIRILENRSERNNPNTDGSEMNSDKHKAALFEMNVGIMGIHTRRVLYVNEEKYIFIYGDDDGNMRVQWLTENEEGEVIYRSFDGFVSGIPYYLMSWAPFHRLILKKFNEQHDALRDYSVQTYV